MSQPNEWKQVEFRNDNYRAVSAYVRGDDRVECREYFDDPNEYVWYRFPSNGLPGRYHDSLEEATSY